MTRTVMRVEYHITPEDLSAYQWRAAYLSPKSRRTRRVSYLYLLVPILVIALLPMIGPGRSVTAALLGLAMLATVFPIIAVAYFFLHRRMLRRAILQLVAQ